MTSTHLAAIQPRISLSDRLFCQLMRSAHPDNRALRALMLPFVVLAILAAELTDLIVLTAMQFAWRTTDGFWARCYRVFIAFAMTLCVAVLMLAVLVLAGCGVPADRPRMDECPTETPVPPTPSQPGKPKPELNHPAAPCYVVVYPNLEVTKGAN